MPEVELLHQVKMILSCRERQRGELSIQRIITQLTKYSAHTA